MASVMSNGIMKALEARIELASILAAKGVEKIMMPDLSSKGAAQKSIGLDMEALRREKEEFKKLILPGWGQPSI
jgi:nitrite reductase (cytochrome c-552)